MSTTDLDVQLLITKLEAVVVAEVEPSHVSVV
jgi:hypothetical protein